MKDRHLRPVREGERPPKRAPRGGHVASARRRALWGRVQKLSQATGMDREDAELVMRDHVEAITGQRSTRFMNQEQTAELFRRLDAMIREDRPSTRAARELEEDPDALITAEQSRTLVQLGLAVGLDRRRLRSWIVGHMKTVCGGRTWPQTRGQAIKVHEGLEAWLVRQPRSQPGQVERRARAGRLYDDLTAWERTFLRDLVERKGYPTPDRRRAGHFFRGHWKQLVKLAEIERKRGKAVDLPEDDDQ